MNTYREFWDVPVEQVPQKTGAATVMDCADIQDVLDNLRVSLDDKLVVDVGCGTGRLHRLCGEYVGYDVAPNMVLYAAIGGLNVRLIDGPQDVHAKGDIVCCLSVFTHLPRDERRAYLEKFRTLAPTLLVDILPDGEESGGIPAWFTPSSSFERDLIAAGFENFDSYSRESPDAALHRYYLAT